jgi:translation initiation factor IF-2
MTQSEGKRQVILPVRLTVKQLAELLGTSPIEIIKGLMRNGIMASVNQAIDYDDAAKLASNLGYEPVEQPEIAAPGRVPKHGLLEEDVKALRPRPPVVTILGHVDHGKTTLLDAIRQSNIVDSEVGAITQHIGAYQVEVQGQKITFIDTPGHEAFTAMRARGAQVTDIAILVVAADDGVMPQTVEAIDHARAAEVPIVVAVNKMDKPNADLERVKQQLADHGLVIEEWGGDVVLVPVSAKKREGLSELLENLLIVAEMEELKANPSRSAIGVVIEAKLDSTRGPMATILVQAGTLKIGDTFVVDSTWGKVKAMFDDLGHRLRRAEPSMPAEILGLESVAQAGDIVRVVADEREARDWVAKRQREQALKAKTPTLLDISSQIREGQVKRLNLILKVDVQGSIEPIKGSLERLENEQVKVRIIHSGSGTITESDVMLAIASAGVIIGFNTRPEPGAKRLAEAEGIEIRYYDVIYNLIEDMEKALTGILEPVYVDVVEGHAQVRAIFNIRQVKVAGAYVTDGKVTRGAPARMMRNGQIIHESNISSLKHFKEHVAEIAAGSECGIGIEGFVDFQIDDIIEVYRKERR